MRYLFLASLTLLAGCGDASTGQFPQTLQPSNSTQIVQSKVSEYKDLCIEANLPFTHGALSVLKLNNEWARIEAQAIAIYQGCMVDPRVSIFYCDAQHSIEITRQLGDCYIAAISST